MQPVQQLEIYLERHFLRLPHLAARAALPRGQLEALILAGALPRPSYSIWPNGAFSSPIGGAHGPGPEGNPTHFYSAAALWWARRARLSDLHPAAIADRFLADFTSDFLARLRGDPLGPLGYPAAYDNGVLDEGQARLSALAEWHDWISGGYGVCLRVWDADHAATKTCQRALIVLLTRDGTATELPAETLDRILRAMQALEAAMLPFAPHQRPYGTPGLWIDRILAQFGLGHAGEDGDAAAAPAREHCA